DEPQDQPADCRLATSRFTDEPERLAAMQVQVDAVDRAYLSDRSAQDAALDREALGQPAHLDERPVRIDRRDRRDARVDGADAHFAATSVPAASASGRRQSPVAADAW